MRDFELTEEDGESCGLRKWVERIVLAAWVVTAIGAALTIIGGHYSNST
jgi:hypothetical protein